MSKPQVATVQRRLQDLLAYPREDLGTELKNWLDLALEENKANLAQAILALANHGGGYVLLGFEEVGGAWTPAKPRPSDLSGFTQDLINGIVQGYADPSFHCELHKVAHPQTGDLFPIVVVPGDHKVPIRAKRDGPQDKRGRPQHVNINTYYIRRPGPKSEPPQSAREWDTLIGRCVRVTRGDLLEGMRSLLLGTVPGTTRTEEESRDLERWVEESKKRWQALVNEKLSNEKPSRYENGVWYVAYSVTADFHRPVLTKLLEILRTVAGHETGWPPWWVPTPEEIRPYPYNGLVECWLAETTFPDAAHSDFWRASPEGKMFLLRGYQEDGVPDRVKPGTVFDLTVPIWRVGECLLHAERFARALTDQPASISFCVTWEGLGGRVLTPWASPERLLYEGRTSHQTSVSSSIKIQVDQIRDALPEIVLALTQPLYMVFDFFDPSLRMIQEELSKMRKGG